MEIAEQRHDAGGRAAVQVAGRFVRQQQARRVHQRAGDGDPLHLAAGELVRAVLAAPRAAPPAPAARPPRSRAAARGERPGGKMFGSATFSATVSVGMQPEVLEDETDPLLPRAGQGSASLMPSTGQPSSSSRPDVGRSMQPSMCSSVVFPAPDGPTTAANSPAASSKLNAIQRPHRLRAAPVHLGETLGDDDGVAR